MPRLSGLMKPPPKVVWRAWSGSPQHAYFPNGFHKALCGAPHVEARFAWPADTKCTRCLSEFDRLTREALMSPSLGL